MSVDHHFHVPAGMRNNPNWKFSDRKYRNLNEMGDKHGCPNHQVFLAHGVAEGCIALFDDQFYFEDARRFYREGYKRMLHEGEEHADRMNLFIDGQETELCASSTRPPEPR
jgi:hypothetical protein